MMISIIIPTCNRSKTLFFALSSIEKQSLKGEYYEVLVIDNGSSDNTKSVVNLFKSKISNLRYFYEETPGLHVGRHIGYQYAESECLVFIDDDVIVSPQWLDSILESFQDNEIKIVGGKNLPHYQIEPPDWLESLWVTNDYGKYCGYLSLLDFGDEIIEIDPNFVWGLNFAIRKKTLFELGGFHPDAMPWELRKYRGDGETGLTRKAKERGLKAIYNPDALVYHQVPAERLTAQYFMKRAYLQGISDSYSFIRANKNIRSWKINNDAAPKRRIHKRAISIVKKSIKKVKSSFNTTNHNYDIENKIKKAFLEGYKYHEKCVMDDPKNFDWVLKENYWNYKSFKYFYIVDPGVKTKNQPK